MSGLDTEEPILQPGRIDVLLGQGQTAQALRNLCLFVFKAAPEDWQAITALIKRLFTVELGEPQETTRGSIDLFFHQPDVKEPLDIAPRRSWVCSRCSSFSPTSTPIGVVCC